MEVLHVRNNENFSTKALTLAFLQQCLTSAVVLPLYYFTMDEWNKNQKSVLAELIKRPWSKKKLVIRSSAANEDSHDASMAGHFTSIVGVSGELEIIEAVDKVISSYRSTDDSHQILIQPFLEEVSVSGVAFGHDPNTGGPYIVINYDDVTGSTDSVTSGTGKETKCFIWHRSTPNFPKGNLGKVIILLNELEEIFSTDLIDIEFAIGHDNQLYLFQARPLVSKEKSKISLNQHTALVQCIVNKISSSQKRHPYLYGDTTVYGVMPDWNPAEIIGIRPRPLALSLYRNVLTDSVWAYQRDNYGYNNLRSFPLLVDFEGLPYIDVRISFNSFLPKGLSDDLAERLVNYYINRLIGNPSLHDKIEFDIIFSCYALDLKERLSVLASYGFSEDEQATIANALTQLTDRIIHNQEGLWRNDLEKIRELEKRQALMLDSELDPVSKMYWLLEDCKRYGTLPFAGLARAGFIAVQLLKSFVAKGIINEEEYERFFSSLTAVGSHVSRDFKEKSSEEFLKLYGHLRPGTYDILSPRYDERPDLYFDWSEAKTQPVEEPKSYFSLSIQQLRAIQKHIENDNLHINVLELLEFIKMAIESREYSKFVFTKSISCFLKLFGEYGKKFGFNLEECSYADIDVIKNLYSTSSW